MNTLQSVGSALGLSFLAGMRLYATVLLLGLAIRFQIFHLNQTLSHLSFLADTKVLVVAGVACVIEFFADKVPWVDSAWDTMHTFIRPIGAALLGAAAFSHTDPALQLTIALLAGGIGFTSSSSKAATRLAANHSPEPFSNIALSLAGDAAIPVGLWLSNSHPYWVLGFLAVFVAIFLWLAPKIWRTVRLEWGALRGLFASWFGDGGDLPSPHAMAQDLNDNLRRVVSYLRQRDVAFPEEYADVVERKLGFRPTIGWRASAAKGVGGLGGSTGYLCLGPSSLVFIAPRWLRLRVHTIDLPEIRKAQVDKRLLLDELSLDLGGRRVRFDLFKSAANKPARDREGAFAK
jgi:hypothetical protein